MTDIRESQQNLEDDNESIASSVTSKDVSLKMEGMESSITKKMSNSPRHMVLDIQKTADSRETAATLKTAVNTSAVTPKAVNSRNAAVLKGSSKRFIPQLEKKHKSPNKNMKYYYHYQHNNSLDINKKQRLVRISIDPLMCDEWKAAIRYGIQDINTAAPGLKLVLHDTLEMFEDMKSHFQSMRLDEKSNDIITIYPGEDPHRSTTYNSIIDTMPPYDTRIYLGNWKYSRGKSTALHELCHGLGLEHEHQRRDGKQFLQYHNCAEDKNYAVNDNYIPITEFDPYSIMIYKETYPKKSAGISRLNDDDGSGWETKEGDFSGNTKLSELDKVGLNFIYPPCAGIDYNPIKDMETEMYYCKRKALEKSNTPYDRVEQCEPRGPNCPACRTLGKPKGIGEKWQGWSGFVYCEEKFDGGKCGPHNGLPCKNCCKIINYRAN